MLRLIHQVLPEKRRGQLLFQSECVFRTNGTADGGPDVSTDGLTPVVIPLITVPMIQREAEPVEDGRDASGVGVAGALLANNKGLCHRDP